jgi:uncharacterized protein YndB with AHSA1/START domain
MQNEIRHTWRFPRSPKEIWEYLTKPELLEQWLAKTDIRPSIGHKFHFFDKLGKTISCEVLEVDPFTRLVYSWQYISAKDNKTFTSKVVWTLVPKDNETELQLLHTGFAATEDYTAHNNGWTNLGNRFTELLNTIKK